MKKNINELKKIDFQLFIIVSTTELIKALRELIDSAPGYPERVGARVMYNRTMFGCYAMILPFVKERWNEIPDETRHIIKDMQEIYDHFKDVDRTGSCKCKHHDDDQEDN